MAVVEVGHVGVSMDQRTVFVDVAVASGDRLVVGVAVVTIGVVVLVEVDQRVVLMGVQMTRSQDKPDAAQGDHHGDDLHRLDRIGQRDPGHDRPEERCGGEDRLPSCGAQLLGAAHPQRDRRPVAERADGERAEQRPDRDRAEPGDR